MLMSRLASKLQPRPTMIGLLMATLLSMSASQTVLQPAVAPSSVVDTSDLLDPFADRQVRSDATHAPSDLIDPFNHPPRRGSGAPVDCSESVLRDPFAPRADAPRTGGTFPGLLDPFAQ
jgi:hypothetical protein